MLVRAPKVRLVPIVKVPMPEPFVLGVKLAAPLAKLTLPGILPVPASVPPLTVTVPVPNGVPDPAAITVPALIVVPPE